MVHQGCELSQLSLPRAQFRLQIAPQRAEFCGIDMQLLPMQLANLLQHLRVISVQSVAGDTCSTAQRSDADALVRCASRRRRTEDSESLIKPLSDRPKRRYRAAVASVNDWHGD
jgi:hypothetical protein